LGSGIPRAESALAEAGMAPPIFHDNGVRFTVRLSHVRPTPAPAASPPSPSDDNRVIVLAALKGGVATVTAIARATGLTGRQVRYTLDALEREGAVQATRRGRGRAALYAATE
ncbi:MAG: hypothetical protein LBL55_01980, partial [Propionibacteriaceae bacterium]|nr:hypothetical protein [Propionibacteriaceae bacterium]